MSSETGVEPALLHALSGAPESQSDAVTALSDILEGPPTTSAQADEPATLNVELNQEPEESERQTTPERITPVQQIEADETRRKRPRITYTPERDSHSKRRRSRSRSHDEDRHRRRSFDHRQRRRSRSRSPRRNDYRERRSEPPRLRRIEPNIEDLLEGKYPLLQPPPDINCSFNEEDLIEPPAGGGLKKPSNLITLTEAGDSPPAPTMLPISEHEQFQVPVKGYPKAPTTLARDGSALTLFFTNKYVFSNHYHCKIVINGALFVCTEQYYMFQKARYFKDEDIAKLILAAKDPKEMKRLGRQVGGFDEHRWGLVSVQIMKIALYYKFVQNEHLRRELFKTVGTTLVEASPMDHFWGVGLAIDNDTIRDPSKWRGRNHLGFLLTTLRDHLMARTEYADEVKQILEEMKAAA